MSAAKSDRRSDVRSSAVLDGASPASTHWRSSAHTGRTAKRPASVRVLAEARFGADSQEPLVQCLHCSDWVTSCCGGHSLAICSA